MKNQELSDLFLQLAIHLEILEVPFKPQAFLKVKEVLATFEEDVGEIYQSHGLKGLEGISGVGKGIAEKIEEYLKTGKIEELEEYKKKMPVDIEGLILIEGIGLKMVKELWQHLKVRDVKDLERMGKEGKIAKLSGFGIKKEKNILKSIVFHKQFEGRWLLGEMYPIAYGYIEGLRNSGLVKQAVIAGSLRRMQETIGNIDILVTTKYPEKTMNFFLRMIPHDKIWYKEKTKISLRSKEGFDINMRVIEEKIFGAALQYFTGSKKHNVRMRILAAKKGFQLSEHGLFKSKKLVACKTENVIYEVLGLQEPDPELREDRGEIRAVFENKLPTLISYDSLKGDLQVQTSWTDGKHSIEEMAREAKKQGLEYISLTDHTVDLSMVGGLDEKKLLLHAKEIDKVQKKISGIKLLKGAEVNIRKDGSLDIANEALSKLDVVGVSVHSNFNMSKKDMTERIVRAIQNPYVNILFHPTGRVLQKRDAYEVDMNRIIQEAKKIGVVLEINGSARMDLKDVYIAQTVENEVKMVINSDAHHKDHFRFLKYGIAQARRGWAKKSDIINTKDVKQFLASLKKRK